MACAWKGLPPFMRRRRLFKPFPVFKTVKPPTPPPPTKPVIFSPVKDSRYCSESKIVAILSKHSRKKRSIKLWPYDCTYPSIVNHQGSYQFMYDIYQCCKKCDLPTYTLCMKKYQRSPPWRCPSDGIHCILECVAKYGPQKPTTIIKPSISKIKGGHKVIGIKPPKNKCEKREKLPNGKTCLRRLCIKLKV
ncbi:uncharacterized protein LOC124444808 [Xenia sp. Carnegie-2017]|uniref:uncharacterized protein LOC124444808 n=1 Tax=Xenia sp. Carnegie-2017 TaxID=2897299 RepID=UPI001F043B12|nr:uncharacterized protein LOC124444808 [Xenia sp. Carnegie-2017]